MSRLLAGAWTVIVTWKLLLRREVDIVLTFTRQLCYSCVGHRNGRVFLCFFLLAFLRKIRMYCLHYFLRLKGTEQRGRELKRGSAISSPTLSS